MPRGLARCELLTELKYLVVGCAWRAGGLRLGRHWGGRGGRAAYIDIGAPSRCQLRCQRRGYKTSLAIDMGGSDITAPLTLIRSQLASCHLNANERTRTDPRDVPRHAQ
jgi:hypothetical protein